jgi:hypothetical protein
MLLKSLAALGVGQILPGLLAVKLLDLGRSLEDRLLFAGVLGGPISGALYLAILAGGLPPVVYWMVTLPVALAAILLPNRSRLALAWPRRSVAALILLVVSVLVPYLATTGSLYRLDAEGNLLLDRALQRDALFHIGLVRSLETAYPPMLVSVAGAPASYHVGYHLELALWARFYGIEPMDALIRLGASWFLALYVLAAYALARRLSDREGVRLLSALLVLASGFGFFFFFRPSVDWWSLAFMDWALVSIFLSNPLLPALPLFFVGMSLLDDYDRSGGRGELFGSIAALGSLFFTKVFLGAQVLAALVLAVAVRRRQTRAVQALVALVVVSSPLLLRTLSAVSTSNTAIGIRPLEIVRYSMEKLDWAGAVEALASAGNFALGPRGWPVVLAATLLWLVGFLGLRVLGLPGLLADLASTELVPRTLAFLVAIGFPLSLIFRVAPAEAQGLSRLEALNDVGWFATVSGIVLWFWTAKALVRARPSLALVAVLGLALPGTVQHFVHESSLPPDRVPASEVAAAAEARRLSSPASVWVAPLDRSRPSALAYLAGRPVVYDPYVGYDYMFVGRDEIDYRRHAVAQFFSSTDAAYRAWFLARYDVDYVWMDEASPGSSDDLLERVFRNDDVALYRVRRDAMERELARRILSVGDIPLGGRGQPFFGSGWTREARGARLRELSPGSAVLYLPLESGRSVSLTLALEIPHEEGELAVGDEGILIDREATPIRIELPPPSTRGLHAVEVSWKGRGPLRVTRLEMGSAKPAVIP